MAKKRKTPPKNDHAAPAAEVLDETAPAEAPPAEAAPSLAPPEFGDLDKVRTILFGAQSQEINHRVERLERHVAQEVAALRDALADRFATLETRLQKQQEDLAGRIKQERTDRTEATRALGNQLDALGETLNEHRAALDQQIAETERTLRQHIDQQGSAAADATARQLDDLTARLEDAVVELRAAKTDRHALAALFTEVAGRLRQD
ncbi:MAG: hypothetical protein R3247_12615 [Rhodothermales bacterium]|nr:hypothetical protein [Rhodothermales bacterium]